MSSSRGVNGYLIEIAGVATTPAEVHEPGLIASAWAEASAHVCVLSDDLGRPSSTSVGLSRYTESVSAAKSPRATGPRPMSAVAAGQRLAENFVRRDKPDAIWARFLIEVVLLSSPMWLVFMVLAFCVGVPGWCGVTLLALEAAHLALPFVHRRTGSFTGTMAAFGALVFIGINWVAWIVGGLPTSILLWTIPIVVTSVAQRRSRRLGTVWGGLCVAQYVVWYALAATGRTPHGYVLSQSTRDLVAFVSLAGWLALMFAIGRRAAAVTAELALARDTCQRALLQSQKLDALSKTADSLSNDFNNVLMSMDYSAHLLAEALAGDAAYAGDVAELDETVERCKALSRKLERLGPSEPCVALVSVDDVVEGSAATFRRLLPPSTTLQISAAAAGAHVLCERNQLDRVLVNLLVNARDAMAVGGEITLTTRSVGDRVVVEVRDTGCGIAPDVLPHIFQAFFTTKCRDSGTGLGLWICRSIAQECGGTLTATSELGVGTTMRIELPWVDPSAPPRRSAPPALRSTRRASSDARTARSIGSARFAGWFAATIADPRSRIWGTAIAAIALSTVPFWLSFGVLYWTWFGMPALASLLVTSAGMCALTPLLLRMTRSPAIAGRTLAVIAFGTLTTLAIARGGFQLQILVWTTIIPIAGSAQPAFRRSAPGWALAALGQCALVYTLAATGWGRAELALAPARAVGEQVMVLVAILALFVLVFRATSRVTDRFVVEREGYEAALVRSQDAETLGTLASSIAHDLNNVLTPLTYATELLKEQLPAAHPARSELDELDRAAGRLHDLARQLTRFGRADHDRASVLIPADALASLEPMLRPIVGSHIRIRLELASGGAAILCRSNAFDQLVINLALNARDAMADGGHLTIATVASDRAVTISLRDSGVGIPTALLDRVCAPFFSTADERVGLGLWVCREIAAEARGDLTIASEPGCGTTVRVTIPRAQIPPALPEPRSASTGRGTAGPTRPAAVGAPAQPSLGRP